MNYAENIFGIRNNLLLQQSSQYPHPEGWAYNAGIPAFKAFQ